MATFDQLKTGDLFVCTDSNGVTYKVAWDKIDDIVLPKVGVWHIKNISGGYVNITDYDRIETVDGHNINAGGAAYKPTSGEYLVYGNLARFRESTANWDFGPLTDTTPVDDFSYLCFSSPKFNGDISTIDVSNGFNLSYLFNSCSAFNQPVTHFNTSKANTMRGMFKRSNFNQPVSHFDTSNCESLVIMFADCPFNKDISGWDVSKVKELNGMFDYNSKFNQNISGWNTKSVINMTNSFRYASAFNQDLSQWCVSSVEYASNTFYGSGTPSSKYPKWGTCPRGEDGNAAAAAASTEPVYESYDDINAITN